MAVVKAMLVALYFMHLKFERRTVYTLLTKPIHPSLRVVEETPDHTIFSLRLIPNFELETILLSLAGEAQVLQPAWLAQRIRERLEKALQEYRKKNR